MARIDTPTSRLQDVPVAVTALTGENLENHKVTTVGDIASFVPSMVAGRQVTGGSASIFLRGAGSRSLSAGFDQSVSFNIDGLAMSHGRLLSRRSDSRSGKQSKSRTLRRALA